MSAARQARAPLVLLVVSALGLAGALAACDLPPATDWPQHQALAALMRRLADHDPAVSATFALNPATHNAGVHLALAALGRWVSPSLAARLVLGLYPPLLLAAAVRLLDRLHLPRWRALLLVPAVLGFSLGWGLINFCLGTALGWLLLDAVLGHLDRPRPGRAAAIALGSLALGVTHVMALALTGLVAAAAALERLGRRETTLGRALAAGALLLPGAVYDLHIYQLHTTVDPSAYVTTAAAALEEPSLLRKLGLLGALLSGLFTSYADTVLAWLLIGGLAAWAWVGRAGLAPPFPPLRGKGGSIPGLAARDEHELAAPDGERRAADGERRAAEVRAAVRDDARSGQRLARWFARVPPLAEQGGDRGGQPAARPLVAPFVLLSLLYVVTPSVAFNTHLIFQRLPQWMLLGALLALPPLPARATRQTRRAAMGLAGVYLGLVPPHLLLHHLDSRGAAAVLAHVPRDACLTGVIEQPRTRGVRTATLVHAAALGVVDGAPDEAFSFARWMGLPVVYRPDHRLPYPASSWEHDGRRYDAADPLARRCPVALVRTARPGEATEAMVARVFGGRAVRVLARDGDWWLVDSR